MEFHIVLLAMLINALIFLVLYHVDTHNVSRTDDAPRVPRSQWKRFNKVHFG